MGIRGGSQTLACIDFKIQVEMEMVQMEAAVWHNSFCLTNVVTSGRGGNKISEKFELSPATREEYLRGTLLEVQ